MDAGAGAEYALGMKFLQKPWFAVVVLLAAVTVWAFAIGPWAVRHGRTAAGARLVLRSATYTRQSVTSPPFSLTGIPATVRISAAPAAGASPAGGTLIASVHWQFVPTESGEAGAVSGSDGLMSSNGDPSSLSAAHRLETHPRGEYRLRVGATTSEAATITTTVVEQPAHWRGLPALWVILLLGVGYVAATVELLHRQYPPAPPLARQRHEYE